MPTLQQRAQSLDAGVRIELFEIDLSEITGKTTRTPGPVQRHHNYPTGNIPWKGQVYTPFPIRIEGIEYKTGGTQPRPHVFVSNIGSVISALMREYNDCIGGRVYRRETLEEFLDGKPGADPTQEYPPDIYKIERKVREENAECEFELISGTDYNGVTVPRETINAHHCRHAYRSGDGCDYAGPPVNDADGNPITATVDRGAHNPATVYAAGNYVYVMVSGVRQYYASLANGNTSPLNNTSKWVRDWCPKTLTIGCKARFGANNPLPFGAFPGTSRLPRI